MSDVVESVRHNIAFQVDRVNTMEDLEQVALDFYRIHAAKYNRIFKEDTHHEVELILKSDVEALKR